MKYLILILVLINSVFSLDFKYKNSFLLDSTIIDKNQLSRIHIFKNEIFVIGNINRSKQDSTLIKLFSTNINFNNKIISFPTFIPKIIVSDFIITDTSLVLLDLFTIVYFEIDKNFEIKYKKRIEFTNQLKFTRIDFFNNNYILCNHNFKSKDNLFHILKLNIKSNEQIIQSYQFPEFIEFCFFQPRNFYDICNGKLALISPITKILKIYEENKDNIIYNPDLIDWKSDLFADYKEKIQIQKESFFDYGSKKVYEESTITGINFISKDTILISYTNPVSQFKNKFAYSILTVVGNKINSIKFDYSFNHPDSTFNINKPEFKGNQQNSGNIFYTINQFPLNPIELDRMKFSKIKELEEEYYKLNSPQLRIFQYVIE